jgi:hypothetical protein
LAHDQTKPWGRGQEAPLTPEYQAILEASIADQAQGGLGNFPTTTGRAAGMPHMMMGFGPMEWVVTPDTTYILIGWYDHYRRIFTDGRDWPKDIEPTFAGYSIGKRVDTDGDGRYDVLEVETCGFKGPRAYDEAGLPLLSYGSYGSYNSYGSFGLQGSCSLRLWAADASNERPRSPAGATPCMAASVAFIICEAHPPSPIGSSHYLQTLQSRIGAPKRRAQSE